MSSTDDTGLEHGLNHDLEDLAPGEEHHEEGAIAEGVRGYFLGLVLAGGLTVASFYIAGSHLVWGPAIPAALMTLAVAQMGVHLIFFLHLTSGPDNTNNILALAFGILTVALVLGGSVWIMYHLSYLMPHANMPMHGGNPPMAMP